MQSMLKFLLNEAHTDTEFKSLHTTEKTAERKNLQI